MSAAEPMAPVSKVPRTAARAISVAILAMGGEGGGVLADWVVDLAEHAGYLAQTTSVPGVAQRTGATIYYVELFPEAAMSAGQQPVLALMPVPGEVDVVIASELMEAGRAVQRGLVTPDRTTLIASTHRVYAMTEKIAAADGRVDDKVLLDAAEVSAKKFIRSDFAKLAEEKRSVISATLFGALAAAAALPFEREQFEEAVRRGGVGVEASLSAFAAGFEAPSRAPTSERAPQPAEKKIGPELRTAATRVDKEFPAAAYDILTAAIARVADYQDAKYASEYLDKLQPICDLDQKHGDGSFALLRETARYLALWMSYEDAARVADLKIRRTRFERVDKEVRANGAQLVQIREFLHPGIDEITDILPAWLGRPMRNSKSMTRLVERFTGNGSIVETTSLGGFLRLYVIAGFRKRRRKSLRFIEEQKKIAAWLESVAQIAPEDYRLAVEVAELPRMIKGYGDTHRRGRKNFEIITSALPSIRKSSDAAAQVKKLREAALADDTGEKLAQALKAVAA